MPFWEVASHNVPIAKTELLSQDHSDEPRICYVQLVYH